MKKIKKKQNQIQKTNNQKKKKKKKTNTLALKRSVFFFSLLYTFFFHPQKIPTEYEFATKREKPWADLSFAKTFGIVTENVLVSYWLIFSLSSVTIPQKSLRKLTRPQFPSRLLSISEQKRKFSSRWTISCN